MTNTIQAQRQSFAHNSRALLIDIADDFQNNYLTPARYAERNGLTESQAIALLELAREVRNAPHPEA